VRRVGALVLYVLGYSAMAMLSPEVAAVPALLVFALGALLLVQRPAEPDPAEAIARELLQR
jgi:hypothetical protein